MRTALTAFILLLLINIFVFMKRDHFLFSKQVSYAELYPVVSSLPVKQISVVNNNSLLFELNLANAKEVEWNLNIEGKQSSFKAKNPVVNLSAGIHEYTLSSNAFPDSISISAEYKSAEKNTSAFIAVYHNNTTPFSLNEYEQVKMFDDPISADQQQKLNVLIKDSVKISNEMSAEKKIMLISIFLNKRIFDSRGEPDNDVLGMNPYDAYNAAVAGRKIWCGIYTRVFNMFCSAVGVKSRAVEMKQESKNVNGSVHEFNEYYSPELRQWIAVDMMFNNAGYRNAAGKLLNGVEVKNLNPNDSSVNAYKVISDSVVTVPNNQQELLFKGLYGKEKELFFYRYTTAEYNAKAIDKIKNYVSDRYWYEFYSDKRVADNRNFYIKQALVFLLLISGICCVLIFIFQFFKRRA